MLENDRPMPGPAVARGSGTLLALEADSVRRSKARLSVEEDDRVRGTSDDAAAGVGAKD
jgi:hypothetical protein